MDEQAILAVLFAMAREIGVSPDAEPARKRLVEAARIAAVELRSTERTMVNLPFLGATSAGPVHLMVELPVHGAARGPVLDPRVKLS